jgi:hypothetical protein
MCMCMCVPHTLARTTVGGPGAAAQRRGVCRLWERRGCSWAALECANVDEPSIDPVDLPEAGPAPPACKLQERVKFHVLLTSYEMLSAESATLSRGVAYGAMIVDEVGLCFIDRMLCSMIRSSVIELLCVIC